MAEPLDVRIAMAVIAMAEPLNVRELLSGTGLVRIFRLTRVSACIFACLTESPHLREAHGRVAAAGCELRPAFAGGATLLCPLTHERFAAAGFGRLALRPHHIVAFASGRDAIWDALMSLKKRRRPQLRDDHRVEAEEEEEEGQNTV